MPPDACPAASRARGFVPVAFALRTNRKRWMISAHLLTKPIKRVKLIAFNDWWGMGGVEAI